MAVRKSSSLSPRWGIGLVVLALVGVFGYDGVRTGLAASGAKDDAVQIAHDTADYYHTNPNVNAAYAQALQEATSRGDSLSINAFTVSQDGAVTLTVGRKTSTLVLARLDTSLDQMTGQATSAYTP